MVPENNPGHLFRSTCVNMLALLCVLIITVPVLRAQQNSPTVAVQRSGSSEQQPESAAAVFTLEECQRIAQENNHSIRAANYGLSAAESRKRQAASGYWPQLSIGGSLSYTDQDPLFTMPGFSLELPALTLPGMTIPLPPMTIPEQKAKLFDKQLATASASLLFPVYTGGKISALNRQAESGIEAARQEYRKSALETRYDVTRYYYAAVLAKRLYRIGTETLERMEMTLKITEGVYQNGSGKTTRLDYLKNKVTVEQIRAIVTGLKKSVKDSKDALMFAMGSQQDFELPETDIPYTPERPEVRNLLETAAAANPDIQSLNAALKYQDARADEAFSGHLPKLALTGSFTQLFNSYRQGMVNDVNRQMWTVGLGAELSIFSGFRTSAEVEEARVSLKKTEEQRLLLQDAVALQIKEAVNRMRIAAEDIANAQTAMESASENRSLNERAFKEDMAEASDLIQAQIMEALTEAQYHKALYEYIAAQANLQYITGTGIK